MQQGVSQNRGYFLESHDIIYWVYIWVHSFCETTNYHRQCRHKVHVSDPLWVTIPTSIATTVILFLLLLLLLLSVYFLTTIIPRMIISPINTPMITWNLQMSGYVGIAPCTLHEHVKQRLWQARGRVCANMCRSPILTSKERP